MTRSYGPAHARKLQRRDFLLSPVITPCRAIVKSDVGVGRWMPFRVSPGSPRFCQLTGQFNEIDTETRCNTVIRIKEGKERFLEQNGISKRRILAYMKVVSKLSGY